MSNENNHNNLWDCSFNRQIYKRKRDQTVKTVLQFVHGSFAPLIQHIPVQMFLLFEQSSFVLLQSSLLKNHLKCQIETWCYVQLYTCIFSISNKMWKSETYLGVTESHSQQKERSDTSQHLETKRESELLVKGGKHSRRMLCLVKTKKNLIFFVPFC